MPTVHLADRLYTWRLQYEDGAERVVLGSSLATLINSSTPIVSATRGAAVEEGGGEPSVLSSLVPDTVVLGSPDFTLHVYGTGFADGDAIIFAGRHEPATFVSDTELTTGVAMEYWLGPDAVPVSVRSLGGAESNALDFTFTVAGARREDDHPDEEPPRREEERRR
jgi:hypothetical protein